jgi:hypothetical protein
MNRLSRFQVLCPCLKKQSENGVASLSDVNDWDRADPTCIRRVERDEADPGILGLGDKLLNRDFLPKEENLSEHATDTDLGILGVTNNLLNRDFLQAKKNLSEHGRFAENRFMTETGEEIGRASKGQGGLIHKARWRMDNHRGR